jgi:hypothetical protein
MSCCLFYTYIVWHGQAWSIFFGEIGPEINQVPYISLSCEWLCWDLRYLVDWISGPPKLFHKLVIPSVDGSGIDRIRSSSVHIYTWEWMNECIMWRRVVSCHFSCLLQQHNTDFIDVSTGLVYAMTTGKEVGGGQDATFDGRSSSSLRTRWPLVPTRAIGVMQDDTGGPWKVPETYEYDASVAWAWWMNVFCGAPTWAQYIY